jgi:2-polyprenyl-3-methyl-5-hydroxy-6-metoxy-1,4-benzoquinol methylase
MFLSIVKDKTVLELGSFGGWHTNLMINLGAKAITCVEPNLSICNNDVYKHNIVRLESCTANDYYLGKNISTVDVVTCLGVLYHLHSPLHLLEQIINKSQPKYLLIETTFNSKTYITDEVYNVPGNAQADSQITMPILTNLIMSMEEIIKCVETTSYKLVKCENNRNKFQTVSKKDISIALFEKTGI